MDLIKEIKWKWMLFKVKFDLIKIHSFKKYMRKNYCRCGIHAIRSSYVSFGGSGQRMKHIRFLKCNWCNYMFFAKKSDKERYLKYNKCD